MHLFISRDSGDYLNWCPREDYPIIGSQLFYCFGQFCFSVFDDMAFIKYTVVKFNISRKENTTNQLKIALKHTVSFKIAGRTIAFT